MFKNHFFTGAILLLLTSQASGQRSTYKSPIHIAVSSDATRAYVVNHTAGSLSVINIRSLKVSYEIKIGSNPVHAVLSRNGQKIFVSLRYANRIEEVDLERQKVVRSIPTGYEPYGIALSKNGKTLFVAESQANRLAAFDLESGKRIGDAETGRDPRYVAVSEDGDHISVSNGLSRNVTTIKTTALRTIETRDIERASLLRQLSYVPGRQQIIVAHIISHDEASALQMERGWINSNGFTLLSLGEKTRTRTILTDDLINGAANPWGIVVSSNGENAFVSLAGVHEIAFIDLNKAIHLSQETSENDARRLSEDVEIAHARSIVKRFPAGGEGPRGMALIENRNLLLVANYFSDSVSVLDARNGDLKTTIKLSSRTADSIDIWRKGEALFNDARICYQRWFSCASCHQEDATIDGLNWDLPNDGVGNFKNAKSLHDIHDTPPAMWSGVRADIHACVAAGQRFLGFLPTESQQKALITFLSSPPRHTNPHKRTIKPDVLKRGQELFIAGACATCHPSPKYTDLKKHDVATRGPQDQRDAFDTPSLRDCYRTAPYLHDGSAATLEDLIKKHNPYGQYGLPEKISSRQVADLAAYLRTL